MMRFRLACHLFCPLVMHSALLTHAMIRDGGEESQEHACSRRSVRARLPLPCGAPASLRRPAPRPQQLAEYLAWTFLSTTTHQDGRLFICGFPFHTARMCSSLSSEDVTYLPALGVIVRWHRRARCREVREDLQHRTRRL